MKSYEILAQAVRRGGIGVLSDNFKVAASTAYRYQQNPIYGSGEPNPLDRMQLFLDEMRNGGNGDITYKPFQGVADSKVFFDASEGSGGRQG